MNSASIRAAVLRFARDHDLLRPGPLVVAVSGGTDSTALVLLLGELAPELGLDLHVAHFDHRTRPRASAADASFVAALAARCGATIRVGRSERRPANEDDARRLRYEFLRRAAREAGARAIATGHTRDDQAETVLLHIARGSGLAGLAGMRPRRDDIVRPLLGIGRTETALVCAEAGITPREDPSNRSLRFARNRVRRRVLPELERLNPEVRAALARLADAAAEVTDARQGLIARALEAARMDDGIALDRLDPELLAAALAHAWRQHTGRTLTATHRAALLALASGRDGSAALDLPGGRAFREYGLLRLGSAALSAAVASADAGGERAHDEAVPLRDGERVEWRGWTIGLSGVDGADEARSGRDEIHQLDEDAENERSSGSTWSHLDDARDRARFIVPAPAGRLVVRARRPGDRLAGPIRTKLQDLFVDAKLPARLRDSHPLVVTEDGAVWWAVGLKHAEGPFAEGRRLVARPPADQMWSTKRYNG